MISRWNTAASQTTTHSQVRERNSCQPSRRSSRKLPAPAPSPSAAGGPAPSVRPAVRPLSAVDSEPSSAKVAGTSPRNPHRNQALTRYDRLSTAIAQPEPMKATRTPPMAAPSVTPRLSVSPRSALACCRRSALTVCGTRPVCAGRKNASAVPRTNCRTTSSQMVALWVSSSQAMTAWQAKRTTSETSITHWRGRRSAHTPPISRKATSGTRPAATTMPRSVVEPISSTAKASATVVIELPISENVWPVKSSRKSRSRSAPNMLARELLTPSLPYARTAPLAASLPFAYLRQDPLER